MNETATLRATTGRPRARALVSPGPLPPAITGAGGSPLDPVDLDPEALRRLGEAAVNDDALVDFASAEPPPLTLDDKAGFPISPEQFYTDVVTDCVEVMGALARDRFEGPSSRRADDERRILHLADAALAAGEGCVGATLAFWRQAASSQDPWKTWAPAFTLATLEGDSVIAAIASGVEGLAPSALAHAAALGEAIALVPRSPGWALDARLASSNHPIARALRLDLAVRSGQLPESAVLAALSEPEAAVADAGLRALDRMEPVFGAAAGNVHALLTHPNRVVAWRAARALTLHGDTRPLDAVRAGGPLAQHLGPLALELFVLRGAASDLPILDRLLSTMKMTPAVLSAIGRFGHARSFALLEFCLREAVLAEAAATALETLFGERVAPEGRRNADEWRRAVAALPVDPDIRLRRGQPWRPSVVAREIESGTLARPAIAARIDELRARAGVTVPVDTGAWGPDFEGPLGALCRAAAAADSASKAGSWACAAEKGGA